MTRLLIVDDSALARKLFGAAFADEQDMQVAFARDGVEAIQQLHAFQPDVITLDVNMPRMDGLACLDRIMLERPSRVVMVAAATDAGAEETLEALRLGAVDFVTKPAGAFSLRMDEFAHTLRATVRAAATAKLRSTSRLREKVQHRIAAAGGALAPPRKRTLAPGTGASGNGLVVVGVSTGGPPALEVLLGSLPSTFPWPIVVAQHMPATFTGSLARRLDGLCALRVSEVTRFTPLEAGNVYIGRGDADVVVSERGGRLVALSVPPGAQYPWHPSTNRLVASAMDVLPARQIVGILLTGMGDDGAEAMLALHAAGGVTIAEAESSAVIWGMPGSLVQAGGASHVAPLHAIAQQLDRSVRTHAPRP